MQLDLLLQPPMPNQRIQIRNNLISLPTKLEIIFLIANTMTIFSAEDSKIKYFESKIRNI